MTIDVSTEDDSQSRHSDSLCTARHQKKALSQIYPTRNTSDPFNCTIGGSDVGIHAMLHYTFAHVAKTSFLAESFAPPSVALKRTSIRLDNRMRERMRRCVEDSVLLYSTLAYTTSFLAWNTGQFDKGRPPEYYTAKALQNLRAHLAKPQNPSDSWLLMSIYALAITEFWNGVPALWTKCPTRQTHDQDTNQRSLRASHLHLSALLGIVEHMGGWSVVDPYVLESYILADKYRAIHLMTRPILQPMWDPGPMPQARQDEVLIYGALLQLGTSFASISMNHELEQLVQDVVDYVRIAHCAWSGRDVERIAAVDERWLFLRLQALIYGLLLFDSPRGFDACIRFSTLIFLLNATQYHGAQVSATNTLQYLRSGLIDAQYWKEEFPEDLLLWCLSTGAMTTELSKERSWFIDRLGAYRHILGPDPTDGDLRSKLESYLFLPEEQESQLSSLVEKLHSIRDTASDHE